MSAIGRISQPSIAESQLTVSSKSSTSEKTSASRPIRAELRQVFCDPEPEIWMDMEPIKDRERFVLTLAAFLDLAPFFIDGVDFVAAEVAG